MLLTIGAYAVLIAFFVVERWVRPDVAKPLDRTGDDRGSTVAVSAAIAAGFVLLLLAPALDEAGVGVVLPVWLGVWGLAIEVAGLVVRVVALRTLGRFFTRTVRIVDDHQLVTFGIYRNIRHPGYLSDLMLFMGAALALRNGLVFVLIAAVFVSAYSYRIRVEERMLLEAFGDEYARYCRRSWKLVPFVV